MRAYPANLMCRQALDRAMMPEANNGVARTVLVIAHRLSTVRNAHTIVVLDKGKVGAGLWRCIFSNWGLYSTQHNMRGVVIKPCMPGVDDMRLWVNIPSYPSAIAGIDFCMQGA